MVLFLCIYGALSVCVCVCAPTHACMHAIHIVFVAWKLLCVLLSPGEIQGL